MLFAATVTLHAGGEGRGARGTETGTQMAMELKVGAIIAPSLRRISLGNLIYGIFFLTTNCNFRIKGEELREGGVGLDCMVDGAIKLRMPGVNKSTSHANGKQSSAKIIQVIRFYYNCDDLFLPRFEA